MHHGFGDLYKEVQLLGSVMPLPLVLQDGATALHLAAEGGHEDAVWTLMAHKAELEAMDSRGQSAAFRAAAGVRAALLSISRRGCVCERKSPPHACPDRMSLLSCGSVPHKC
jgi:ankyrin repeat protein